MLGDDVGVGHEEPLEPSWEPCDNAPGDGVADRRSADVLECLQARLASAGTMSGRSSLAWSSAGTGTDDEGEGLHRHGTGVAAGSTETWGECQAVTKGVPGARYQSVDSREKAEQCSPAASRSPRASTRSPTAMRRGGVGVVVIHQDTDDQVIPRRCRRRSCGSSEVIAGLATDLEVAEALARIHNILAELAGLYHALRLIPSGKSVTIVHDYKEIGLWMESRWKTKDMVVKAVIEACRREVEDRQLDVGYLHQRGHQSSWAGRDDCSPLERSSRQTRDASDQVGDVVRKSPLGWHPVREEPGP